MTPEQLKEIKEMAEYYKYQSSSIGRMSYDILVLIDELANAKTVLAECYEQLTNIHDGGYGQDKDNPLPKKIRAILDEEEEKQD